MEWREDDSPFGYVLAGQVDIHTKRGYPLLCPLFVCHDHPASRCHPERSEGSQAPPHSTGWAQDPSLRSGCLSRGTFSWYLEQTYVIRQITQIAKHAAITIASIFIVVSTMMRVFNLVQEPLPRARRPPYCRRFPARNRRGRRPAVLVVAYSQVRERFPRGWYDSLGNWLSRPETSPCKWGSAAPLVVDQALAAVDNPQAVVHTPAADRVVGKQAVVAGTACYTAAGHIAAHTAARADHNFLSVDSQSVERRAQ